MVKIHHKLDHDQTLTSRTKMSTTQAFCLKTAYFLYDNVLYSQVEGAAMGSPVSPIVVSLFIEWFEVKKLETFRPEITRWRWYVDDTIAALCDSLLDVFTTHVNSIHLDIEFTLEDEVNGKIAMLDTQIERSPSHALSFSVYWKPTHTDQCLQFDSSQPLQHKLGMIRTLYHHCDNICYNEQAKLQEVDHLLSVLRVSGYTTSAWITATRPRPPAVSQGTNATKVKGSITLPYVGHVTDAVARTICRTRVTVHLCPFNTIRSSVVNPKDEIPKEERSGVVYNIQCSDCDAIYIGETGASEKGSRNTTAAPHLWANTQKHIDIPSPKKMSPCYTKSRTGSAGGGGSHSYCSRETRPQPGPGPAHPPGLLPAAHPFTGP